MAGDHEDAERGQGGDAGEEHLRELHGPVIARDRHRRVVEGEGDDEREAHEVHDVERRAREPRVRREREGAREQRGEDVEHAGGAPLEEAEVESHRDEAGEEEPAELAGQPGEERVVVVARAHREERRAGRHDDAAPHAHEEEPAAVHLVRPPHGPDCAEALQELPLPERAQRRGGVGRGLDPEPRAGEQPAQPGRRARVLVAEDAHALLLRRDGPPARERVPRGVHEPLRAEPRERGAGRAGDGRGHDVLERERLERLREVLDLLVQRRGLEAEVLDAGRDARHAEGGDPERARARTPPRSSAARP